MRQLMRNARPLAATLALALLAACSGGAPVTQSASAAGGGSASTYTGPAPATADVQAFKVNLWQNINTASRCGNCHKAGGQSPMFARPDDVNLAYNDALGVVDLSRPDQSRMVTKVAGGHNCWLSSAQSCADILTTWIRNWAGGVAAGATQVQLVPPVVRDVGNSLQFPARATDNGANSFANTVYPLLSQFCSRCHSASAATPQTPYFASSDVAEAYANAQAKINLDTPTLSRFYVRLADEHHNCWAPAGTAVASCPASSAAMLAAIQAFAGAIQPTQVDPSLVTSKALGLYDGTIASGNNRYDGGLIARWQFKEGSGSIANDTSGVDPALNLTVAGDVSWVGGWGLRFGPNGGEARGGAASHKLYDLIHTNAEYSIELWAAPANVTQEDAYIASYSGGNTARNVTIGQHAYQYEVLARSSATDANGAPALLTRDADRDAQASLQHVVLTYSPVTGRKLYVNGLDTGDVDAQKSGTLGNWDDTFVFLLGNETGGNRKWQGTIRFAAVFNHALTPEQVQQNFTAGVGERYFLLFDVSSLVNVPQSYVMFTVSRYDSYSYLFDRPVFITLTSGATLGSIPVQGLRIGMNGAEVRVGQAYANVDTVVSDANYVAGAGQRLSTVGTVIALEKGPENDLFFLDFDRIGSHFHARTEPAVPAPAPPADRPEAAQLGLRTFGELNASMAAVTGVATTDAAARATYVTVQQQLPGVPNIETFVASHQVGIAQLAIQYCDSLVESARAASFFPGLNLSATPATAFADTSVLVDPLVNNAVGTNLATQPDYAEVRAELDSLVAKLSACGSGCSPTRTRAITKAACATVVGGASLLVK